MCAPHVCTGVRSAAKARKKLKQLQAAKPQHSVEELLSKVRSYSRSAARKLGVQVVYMVCLAF